jgi:hypothetical protein
LHGSNQTNQKAPEKRKKHNKIFSKNMSEKYFKKNHQKIKKMFFKKWDPLLDALIPEQLKKISNPTSRFIVMSGHTFCVTDTTTLYI